jgi:hypothetical protein
VRLFSRGATVPPEVLRRAALARGEKVLASAPSSDGSWLIGTRAVLVVVRPGDDPVLRLPWEQVEDAAWDQEEERFTITATGAYGEPRPAYAFTMDDPALLLQLVRERVTASIVLQLWVPVRAKQGLTVIGRRSPAGGDVAWMHAYDRGLDPDDQEVAAVATAALAQARSEVGEEDPHPI